MFAEEINGDPGTNVAGIDMLSALVKDWTDGERVGLAMKVEREKYMPG